MRPAGAAKRPGWITVYEERLQNLPAGSNAIISGCRAAAESSGVPCRGQLIALALGRVIPAAPAGKRVHHEASGGTRTLTTLWTRKLEFQSRFFGCMMTVAE